MNPNGGQRTITQFEYANPRYDRYERTSGHYTLRVTQPDDDIINIRVVDANGRIVEQHTTTEPLSQYTYNGHLCQWRLLCHRQQQWPPADNKIDCSTLIIYDINEKIYPIYISIAVQHLQYLPYGEPYIDQRAAGTTYRERFRFTGKERDEETGYGYFGARYMDHELMTMWLSVDPLAEKYPSISPYAYCAWNPVKLVDPDGMEIDDYFTRDGKYLGSDNAKTNYVRIVSEYSWSILDKDENGKVDHDLVNEMSTSFSKASEDMSEEAQLGVYQHYNLTGKGVEAAPPDEITSKNPMMITKVGCKDGDLKKDIAIVTHLYIPLVNNSTPNSKGDALCDNADEIVNSFVHERDHMQRALKMGYGKWLKMNNSKEGKRDVEYSAIKAQREHSSWSGCRNSFKEGVKNYEERF